MSGPVSAAQRPRLWFVHGWGFDASIWDTLRERLADWPHAVADAGYYGAPAWPATPGPVVAIAHSQGVMQALQRMPEGCVGLVSINGFSRFSASPDHPAGVAVRVLDRMIAQFRARPGSVVDDFRRRCGGAPASRPLDTVRLGAALDSLRDDDARAELADLRLPVAALASDADVVVPHALTDACFAGRASIEWNDGGDHLLPQSEPDWCAARIRAYLAALPGEAR